MERKGGNSGSGSAFAWGQHRDPSKARRLAARNRGSRGGQTSYQDGTSASDETAVGSLFTAFRRYSGSRSSAVPMSFHWLPPSRMARARSMIACDDPCLVAVAVAVRVGRRGMTRTSAGFSNHARPPASSPWPCSSRYRANCRSFSVGTAIPVVLSLAPQPGQGACHSRRPDQPQLSHFVSRKRSHCPIIDCRPVGPPGSCRPHEPARPQQRPRSGSTSGATSTRPVA